MPELYKDIIARLIESAPFDIDTQIRMDRKPPTMASSEFLTNKQQGDWAEEIVFNAINGHSTDHMALRYGRSDSASGTGD